MSVAACGGGVHGNNEDGSAEGSVDGHATSDAADSARDSVAVDASVDVPVDAVVSNDAGTDVPSVDDVQDDTASADVQDVTMGVDVVAIDVTDVAIATDVTDVAIGTDVTDVAMGTDVPMATDVVMGTDVTDVATGVDVTDTGPPACLIGTTRPCYAGASGTEGVGVCHGGTQTCAGGVWGSCIGEVDPSAEVCNGLDDNCDGTVDEGNPGGGVACAGSTDVGPCIARTACVAGAIVCHGTFVAPAPTGLATNSGASNAPLNTITAAIANARIVGGTAAVCVCAPPASPSTATYTENVTMVQGVSVYGGYRCDTWARAIATYVTRIQDTTPAGVLFPAGITTSTSLDGMTVLGAISSSPAASTAITVTDSSPTLQDVIATSGAGTTGIALHATQVAGTSAPVITRGSYTGLAMAGGTAVGVQLDAAVGTFTGVTMSTGAPAGGASPLSGTGLLCNGCGATHITGGFINGGSTTMTSTGLELTGTDTGFTVTGPTNINGGFVPGAVTPVSRGAWLNGCTGAPSFTGVAFSGGSVPSGLGAGVDISGASCNPTLTNGTAFGCENGQTCVGIQSTGSPITATGLTMIRGGLSTSLATYGVRCLTGGCTTFDNNTIWAGTLTLSAGIAMQSSAAVELVGGSAHFDSNNIRSLTCAGGLGPYYGMYLHGNAAPVITNNVIRESVAACNAPTIDVLRFERTFSPATASPQVVNNTLEYSGCATCGVRHGINLTDVGGGSREGVFNNNIVRNVGTGTTNIPVNQGSASDDVTSFENNDLYDATATALFNMHGSTPLATIAAVNSMVLGAAANISANALLDATWHQMAGSPTIDTGTMMSAPANDFDGAPRPNPSTHLVDIGADEN